jgi:hypothetical protein
VEKWLEGEGWDECEKEDIERGEASVLSSRASCSTITSHARKKYREIKPKEVNKMGTRFADGGSFFVE